MTKTVSRRSFIAAVGVVSLSGCLSNGRDDGAGSDSMTGTNSNGGDSVDKQPSEQGGPPNSDVRLPLPDEPDGLRERSLSGGVPKDGIAAIDDPTFESAEEAADRFEPGDPVFGVATGSEVKAYPQSILVWHEICNDVVDGVPVSVTYCPLTGTAMGFERGDTTFGVSGRLVNNNLIMYDRATETWWPQVLATSIPGPWFENPSIRSLREFRVVWTTWERWENRYPDTKVLSRDTGFAHSYQSDPYGSYNPRKDYYEPDSSPMFPSFTDDDRLDPKSVVIGSRTPEGAAAFEKRELRSAKLIDGELGDTPILATYDRDLDTGYVYENPDRMDFEPRDGEFVAHDGAAYGATDIPLEQMLAFDAMWFAWSGFYPDTELYD